MCGCVCVCSSCVCVCVCAYEWGLRDRLWLDWCPSPDESEILMCQQGWIMHTPPLPLLSTSCLQSFASLFITTATSEDIFTFLFTPPPLLPLLPLCKRGHRSPVAAAASLSSGQPSSSTSTASSFSSSSSSSVRSLCCLLCRRFCTLHDKQHVFFLFGWHLRWKWLKVLMYTAHYPIMGGRSAAIDSVWQLHPWLTAVIRRVSLTDKMADKAGDKLPNQNLEKEWAPSTLKCTVSPQ